eukprot:766810-Hanusia_phi.AAC.2
MRRDLEHAVPLDMFRDAGVDGVGRGGRRGGGGGETSWRFLSPESFEPPQLLAAGRGGGDERERVNGGQETRGFRTTRSKDLPRRRREGEEDWMAGDELVSSSSEEAPPPRNPARHQLKRPEVSHSTSSRHRKLSSPRGLSELLANAGLSGYEKLLVRNGWDSLGRVQLMAEEDLVSSLIDKLRNV